jgi:hypothetical protein
MTMLGFDERIDGWRIIYRDRKSGEGCEQIKGGVHG